MVHYWYNLHKPSSLGSYRENMGTKLLLVQKLSWYNARNRNMQICVPCKPFLVLKSTMQKRYLFSRQKSVLSASKTINHKRRVMSEGKEFVCLLLTIFRNPSPHAHKWDIEKETSKTNWRSTYILIYLRTCCVNLRKYYKHYAFCTLLCEETWFFTACMKHDHKSYLKNC